WQHGVPSRFSPEVREFAAASEDRAFVREMEIADVTAGHLEPIGAHDSSKPPAVVVWGDSHAMAAMSAFDSWLRENGRSGWQATRSATPPLLDYWYSSVVLGPRSHEFAEGVIAFVTKHRVPNTVLVARWSAYAHVGHGDPRAALLKTIAALAPSGTRVWIVAEMPGHTFLVPHVLATASYRNIDYTHLQSRPDGSAGLLDDSPEWLSQLHASGVRILDARPLFIDRAGCYAIEQDGIALYRDEHHLSSAGAIQILKPLLRRTVDLNDESGAHTK
ncbi:MAG: SGNH hydrolase domain-containing protein, partial [Planctomycetota bacterium]